VIDWNPWAVRRPDGDHPDELRIDLDPTPGSSDWGDVRRVALCALEVLEQNGLVGFPKTSGSRGIHVYCRIEQEWDFLDVRRSALALAREVERQMPGKATSKWWKEERVGVFIDSNQNARDRTIASAYSVRPTPDSTVSAPLHWDEVPDAEIGDFRLDTPCRSASRRSATRARGSTTTSAASTGCSTWRPGTRRRASATPLACCARPPCRSRRGEARPLPLRCRRSGAAPGL